ncbi:MAG: helicase-related protein, partial [Candidatus Limnocylindrales bacterium]
LVFTRTKHGANRLAQQLERDGISAVAIHGNKSQAQRVRALAEFKTGRTPILVATEIAARGLDIDSLPHVVNFELPMVPSDYVHRIGRTGRAGITGSAVSLVCVDELKLLGEIERILGGRIPQVVVAGFEPDRTIRPEPILRGGLGRSRPEPRVQRGGFPTRSAAPARDGAGFAAPRRPVSGPRPGPGRPINPPVAGGRPTSGRGGQGRPSAPRPGAGIGNGQPPMEHGADTAFRNDRSGQGRPAQVRSHSGGPAQGRPGQDRGRGRPDQVRSGPRHIGQPVDRPRTMPGERLSRGG